MRALRLPFSGEKVSVYIMRADAFSSSRRLFSISSSVSIHFGWQIVRPDIQSLPFIDMQHFIAFAIHHATST